MSEQEKFLDRWSRRKQEAAKQDADGAEAKSAAAQPAVPDTPEPEFDVSKLPSVDTISAATDIRAFLSAGVPAQLTRTALRNAWAADPAIRDFIGLSENSWDFNAPETIPGFGSIGSSVDLREMAEQVFGHAKKTEEDPANSGGEAQSGQVAAQSDGEPESVSLDDAAPDAEIADAQAPDQTARANVTETVPAADAAPHNTEPEQFSPAPRRKHGSALPS